MRICGRRRGPPAADFASPGPEGPRSGGGPIRRSDVTIARVKALEETAPGRRVATLRLAHRDHRADRWWSFCDLAVVVPDGVGELRPGDAVEIVLGSGADASRVADGPGHYSCRLHPASEPPVLPPERAQDGVFGGLIERTEPPDGGDLVLHLGSGLTCYPQLAGEGPFPPESLRHGEWSEFILHEPHRVVHLVRAAAGP